MIVPLRAYLLFLPSKDLSTTDSDWSGLGDIDSPLSCSVISQWAFPFLVVIVCYFSTDFGGKWLVVCCRSEGQ